MKGDFGDPLVLLYLKLKSFFEIEHTKIKEKSPSTTYNHFISFIYRT